MVAFLFSRDTVHNDKDKTKKVSSLRFKRIMIHRIIQSLKNEYEISKCLKAIFKWNVFRKIIIFSATLVTRTLKNNSYQFSVMANICPNLGVMTLKFDTNLLNIGRSCYLACWRWWPVAFNWTSSSSPCLSINLHKHQA